MPMTLLPVPPFSAPFTPNFLPKPGYNGFRRERPVGRDRHLEDSNVAASTWSYSKLR